MSIITRRNLILFAPAIFSFACSGRYESDHGSEASPTDGGQSDAASPVDDSAFAEVPAAWDTRVVNSRVVSELGNLASPVSGLQVRLALTLSPRVPNDSGTIRNVSFGGGDYNFPVSAADDVPHGQWTDHLVLDYVVEKAPLNRDRARAGHWPAAPDDLVRALKEGQVTLKLDHFPSGRDRQGRGVRARKRAWDTRIVETMAIARQDNGTEGNNRDSSRMSIVLDPKVRNDAGVVRGVLVGEKRYNFPVSTVDDVPHGEYTGRLILSYVQDKTSGDNRTSLGGHCPASPDEVAAALKRERVRVELANYQPEN